MPLMMSLRRSSGLSFDGSAIAARFSFPSGVANLLTPFRSQQARGGAPCSTSAQTPVRLVRVTGQTGRRVHRRETNEHPPGRDPVEVGTPWVVLGSAGQLGRPLMPWR